MSLHFNFSHHEFSGISLIICGREKGSTEPSTRFPNFLFPSLDSATTTTPFSLSFPSFPPSLARVTLWKMKVRESPLPWLKWDSISRLSTAELDFPIYKEGSGVEGRTRSSFLSAFPLVLHWLRIYSIFPVQLQNPKVKLFFLSIGAS